MFKPNFYFIFGQPDMISLGLDSFMLIGDK